MSDEDAAQRTTVLQDQAELAAIAIDVWTSRRPNVNRIRNYKFTQPSPCLVTQIRLVGGRLSGGYRYQQA